MMSHQSFATTTRGLQRQSPPMRLWEKAKRFGIWNPSDIDFSQDRRDWQTFSPEQKKVILHLTSLFQAGEEAVTLDLLPLVMVIAQEGRIEEEMFLTSFLWEEAKHTDFFRRFLDEVAQDASDLSHFSSENYRAVVYEALPQALNRLRLDPSPAAQIKASVTYNLIVEGVLAETGYHAYFTILNRSNVLPGMRKGITLLKQDESRHIAYGIFLLSRLIAADASLWQELEETMNNLLTPAVGVVGDIFSCYDPMPFDVREEDFVEYAMDQFQKRYERLEQARGATLDEIYRITSRSMDEEKG
jgi:ribonucleoside-diphosphate reductase beta chain